MRDYSRSELENGINEYVVGRNAARNRVIMRYKLIDGYSIQHIADILNSEEYEPCDRLEPRQIQRVISKYSKIIFRHI